jgi:cytochrome c oxidase assembly factor CtaG
VTLLPLPVIVALALVAAYALAARRVRYAGRRAAAFATGAASAGALIAWDPATLPAHMVQHGLLTTVAAPLLVLGQPVALALRLAPVPRRQRFYGMSGRLRALLDPWTGLILFVVVQWIAHWPALLEAAEARPWLHAALHLLLLDVAVLFFLPLFGRQPLPRRLSSGRAAIKLLVAIPLIDLICVPYVATGRADAAAAMLAAMAPLAVMAIGLAWQALLREEREMVRREAVS